MKKSPEESRKFGRREFIVIPALSVAFLTLAKNAPAWANPTTEPNQTVPNPTATPETELQNPIMSFTTEVNAYDKDRNPVVGVVVAFVNSPVDTGLALTDEELDLSQEWSVGIAPLSDPSGISQDYQFSQGSQDGVIAGEIAEAYFESLIQKAEDEGDHETADYLRNNYPPLRPLEILTTKLSSPFSHQGEAPINISVNLKTDANGKHTAFLEQTIPTYMKQKTDGSLGVIGEDYGLVKSLSETDLPGITFQVEYDVTGDTPKITVTDNNQEQIIVTPLTPEDDSVTVANTRAIVLDDLNNIGVTVTDEFMNLKQIWFENNSGEVVSTAESNGTPVEPPTFSINDRRLSLTVDGSVEVNPNNVYQAIFKAQNKSEFVVTAEGILATDKFKIGVENNQIMITDLSGTNHLPTIKINGILYSPNEPHPIDTDPIQIDPTQKKLFAPAIYDQ